MDPEPAPNRRWRRALTIAVLAAIVIAVTAVVYLGPGQALRARASPTPLGHVHTQTPAAAPSPCPPTSLAISGAVNDCAVASGSFFCPPDLTSSPSRVERLSGRKFDFLLYIGLGGAYHGPGAYALTPWPGGTLDALDGVVKVALREYVSGTLWESAAGSVTFDPDGKSGSVFAGLVGPSAPAAGVAVTVAGQWRCP